MFIQKKYPEGPYKLHIELTQEEAESLVEEIMPRDRLASPIICRLLSVIEQVVRDTRGC